MDDLQEIKDLTPEEYDATYAEGEPHGIPEDVLEQAIADADQEGAQEEIQE